MIYARLVQRVEELIPQNASLSGKIPREIVSLAKIDINEEINIFRAHTEQFHQLLCDNSTHIGKTLEFLLQELQREINTIGAKLSDSNVSSLVVKTKGTIEKIREQVQNVE